MVFFLRNDLSGRKDRTSMINLNSTKSKETHWISLLIGRNTAVYFDSFRIEYAIQEILGKIKDKSTTNNIFRIQGNDSIVRELSYRFYRIFAYRRNFVRLY